MHFGRTCVLAAVVAVAPAALPAHAGAQQQRQLRWYDAYDFGVKAVQARDWASAEKYLQQSKEAAGSPPQGRRVFYYGDTYRPFYPDYYLAIVYLNTRRQALAETAFADVAKRALIDPKDPRYKELQQQASQATFERSMDEARGFIAKNDLAEADKRAAEARSTNFDNGKADTMRQEIAQLAKKLEPVTPAPVVPSDPTPVKPAPVSVDAKNDPPVQPPAYNPTPAPKPIVPTALPSPAPQRPAAGGMVAIGGGGLVGALYAEFWRNGLLAYFTGDYGEAIRQFETMPQANAPSRVQLFLACARAGVVLTGGGDAAMLRTARAGYREAGGADGLLAQDRRFISPKILALLEKS